MAMRGTGCPSGHPFWYVFPVVRSGDPNCLPVLVLAERERAFELLQSAYAEGTITVEELEQRIERVQVADNLPTVRLSVADLVSLLPAARSRAPIPASEVPDRGLVVSIMGGTEKKGGWPVPRKSFVWTTMGGTDLDYREAVFGPGVHEVYLFTMWGGVDLIVSPDINVVIDGIGIMGGFGGESSRAADPNAPTLRVIGVAIMGAVEVDVRLPGESSSDARKRRKHRAREALKGSATRALGSGE